MRVICFVVGLDQIVNECWVRDSSRGGKVAKEDESIAELSQGETSDGGVVRHGGAENGHQVDFASTETLDSGRLLFLVLWLLWLMLGLVRRVNGGVVKLDEDVDADAGGRDELEVFGTLKELTNEREMRG